MQMPMACAIDMCSGMRFRLRFHTKALLIRADIECIGDRKMLPFIYIEPYSLPAGCIFPPAGSLDRNSRKGNLPSIEAAEA